MDTPENYYATLGIPGDADSETIKRAYRQLARRFHPDLAGPEGALEMKRINRAYAVLGDAEKKQQYDTIIGGVVDLRRKGFVRPTTRQQRPENPEDVEFFGLNIFSTRGPFRAGPAISSSIGVISTLSSIRTVQGILVAAGTTDGKGMIWQIVSEKVVDATSFAGDPAATIESLRELRFSNAGSLLAGWGRLGLNVWDAFQGTRLWSYPLTQRAVSAHYSLDVKVQALANGKRLASIALPHLAEDGHAPRAWGVRSTDIAEHDMGAATDKLSGALVCTEESTENRHFWAIRMRALAQDARALVTLSCAQVANEQSQMAIVRRWDLTTRGRLGTGKQPQIVTSVVVGRCQDCAPPYASTPDASMLAFVYVGNKIRLCETLTGVYSEFATGAMGSTARLAISPDGQWLAVAREDSEANEGVIDLWSIATGQVVQKFYHPWQISAIDFTDDRFVVALTDGTIQVWQ
ncbi:MAG: hypothetical protein NVS2B12_28770 [Ktedonobacteraceae bacterium]